MVLPQWTFEEPGFLDGYCYLGHVLGPIANRLSFPNHPSGDLLPVFWPKHFLFQLFPPLWANAVEKILVATLILFLVFSLGRNLSDRVFGFMATILTAANTYFWTIVSSEYPEAMTLLYVTLTFYLAERAAHEKTKWHKAALGIAMACSISSAFLSLGYMASAVLLYLALKWQRRLRVLDFRDFLIPMGFFLGIGVLALANWSYTGDFYYFANTVNKARAFLNQSRQLPFWQWFTNARWLDFPCIIVVFFLMLSGRLFAQRRRPDAKFLFLGSSVFSFAFLSGLQFVKKQGTISDPYYFYQLLTVVSISTAIVFDEVFFERLRLHKKTLGVLSIVILIVGLLFKNVHGDMATEIGLAILFFGFFSVRVKKSVLLTGLAWVALLGASISLTNAFGKYGRVRQDGNLFADFRSGPQGYFREQMFRANISWYEIANRIDPHRKSLMWYDASEPQGFYFRNFAGVSHLWQGGLINEKFPQTDPPPTTWQGPSQIPVAENMDVLVVTSQKVTKMQKLAGELDKKNLKFEILTEETLSSVPVSFDILLLHLSRK